MADRVFRVACLNGESTLMGPRKRILVVDDEESIRDLLTAMLDSLGYETEVAKDGLEGLAKLDPDLDLVLLDAMMPGLSGYEVVHRIRRNSGIPDVPVIMVTALASKEDRLRAVESGANDFIAKPFDLAELRIRTNSLLQMKEAQDAVKRNRIELEETVDTRTAALRRALGEMEEAKQAIRRAHLDTIHRLALVAEYKDTNTSAHIHRMSHYCALLATELGLSSTEVELIQNAGAMHDVGKIGIPDAILLKPGKLSASEWEIMKQHTTIGAHILSGSSSDLLQLGKVIALTHHEKWDGTGYPRQLAGEDIPISGRICALADVFDALTSSRPYKEAFSDEKSLKIMTEETGKHFDPLLLDLFVDRFDEVVAIRKEYSDDRQ
jgi:putative two-component system response regulator